MTYFPPKKVGFLLGVIVLILNINPTTTIADDFRFIDGNKYHHPKSAIDKGFITKKIEKPR